ncbi:MAG: O-antigen ligase family protein, partial [Gammaproteobacteria bacterium]|nr:O-antigen ligase family protein [Gammaproteobacteria bacterium]
LICQQRLQQPALRAQIVVLLVVGWAGLSSGWSTTPYTALQYSGLVLSGALIAYAMVQMDAATRDRMYAWIIVAALSQIPLVLMQKIGLDAWLPDALCCRRPHASGMVGNEEFLSFLLVAAMLLLHHLRQTAGRIYWPLAVILLIGLVVLKNKGGLIFLAVAFIWSSFPRQDTRIKWIILISLVLVAALVMAVYFPNSIKGRILLWLVALTLFSDHFFTGVGYRQFGGHVPETLQKLFHEHPYLREKLGDYAAYTRDAHNLPLQMAAELGLLGGIFAVVFLVWLLRASYRCGGSLGALGYFAVFKSLITVVLNSVSGMLIIGLVAAALIKVEKKEKSVIYRKSLWGVAVVLAGLVVPGLLGAASDFYYSRGYKASLLDDTAATGYFKKALLLKPDSADASLGLAYLAAKSHDINGLNAFLEHNLRYATAIDHWKMAAHIYMYVNEDAKALALYNFLHESYPDQLTPVVNAAKIYLRNGQHAHALRYANIVLEREPRIKSRSYTKNKKIAEEIIKQVLAEKSEK